MEDRASVKWPCTHAWMRDKSGEPAGIRTQDTGIKSPWGRRPWGPLACYPFYLTHGSRPLTPPRRSECHRRGCQCGCQHRCRTHQSWSPARGYLSGVSTPSPCGSEECILKPPWPTISLWDDRQKASWIPRLTTLHARDGACHEPTVKSYRGAQGLLLGSRATASQARTPPSLGRPKPLGEKQPLHSTGFHSPSSPRCTRSPVLSCIART